MEVAQELMPAIQPPTSPAGQAVTPPSVGPPTPQSLDVGGDLPTIHEENEERDADELIIESFYAELMSDQPLEADSRFEVERGNAPPIPVHTMPETQFSPGQKKRILRFTSPTCRKQRFTSPT